MNKKGINNMWKLKMDISGVYGNAEFVFKTVAGAARFIEDIMEHTCNEMEFHLVKVKKVAEELALPAEESEVE
jgi:hypothetical protein